MTLAIFAAIAAPYVWMLSSVKGRFTTGDSGRLNYAWHANGIPRFHWRGQPAGSGAPVHPTRQLNTRPAVYEFGEPVKGTYPIWYDAGYWNEGLKPRFQAAGQIKVIRSALSTYFFVLTRIFGAYAAAFAVLALLAGRGFARDLRAAWPLLAAPAAAFGMYALVHAELRYLGPFAAAAMVVSVAAIRIPPRRMAAAAGCCMAASVILAAGLIRAGNCRPVRNGASASCGRSATGRCPTRREGGIYPAHGRVRQLSVGTAGAGQDRRGNSARRRSRVLGGDGPGEAQNFRACARCRCDVGCGRHPPRRRTQRLASARWDRSLLVPVELDEQSKSQCDTARV